MLPHIVSIKRKPEKGILLLGFLALHFMSFSQGSIIMQGATLKMSNTAYVSTSDIIIESTGAVFVDSSTIKIGRDISNAGILNIKNGSLEMNGSSPQTIPANSITDNILKNLIVSNDFTLQGQDSVTGTLSFGSNSKTITTGGFLTLKSTEAATARMADITNSGLNSGNTVSGNVHVERYINSVRGWRLLTAPIQSETQTIRDAWQEGQTSTNNLPGYGTHITGGSSANGFDQGVNPLNIGVKAFVSGVWTGLTNTNVNRVADRPGYMVFIRGNRGTDLSLGLYAPVTSTTLRSTGGLKMNNQVYTVAAVGFTVIGNPYASAINLDQIAKANPSNKTSSINIQDNFYLWDPKLTGSNSVGGYVNVSWNGASYDITPASGGSGLNQFVQSGSAFLARSANGTTAGTLVIKESDKSAAENRNVNRPANNNTGKLRTNLYALNTDGTIPLVDGILNSYDDMYSNGVDNYDAIKIKNFSESLSSQRDGVLLVVERKQLITEADTIFLNMLQMKAKSYRFEFLAENFNTMGLTGFLLDSYANVTTALDLTGTTIYDFTVIDVPGSWNPNRFRIVFKQVVALPVTLIKLRGFEQTGDIKVTWQTENDASTKTYEIEKSADGRQFVKVATLAGSGNNTSAHHYYWLDKKALTGYNYYRLKSVLFDAAPKYTSVIKVFLGRKPGNIHLLTNLIASNVIILQFNDMPKGSYAMRITNTLGQLMYRKTIDHEGGSSTADIKLNKKVVSGVYYLNIIKPDLSQINMKVVMD